MDAPESRALTAEHVLVLAFASVAIMASVLLELGPDDMIHLPVPFLGKTVPLPPGCMFRTLTGFQCPGCGLTRSFVAMPRGEFRTALRLNPMGPFLYVVCLLQIPYRIIELVGIGRGNALWTAVKEKLALLVWVIFIGLMVQWVVRTALGLTWDSEWPLRRLFFM